MSTHEGMTRYISTYLDALLTLCNDAVTIIDRDGTVLYWNEAAEAIYSISKTQILHRNISNFFESDDLMVLRILKEPQPVAGVYHRPRPDMHVLINASPIYDENESLIGAISVEQNINQIVRLNDELTQTSSLLDELKSQMNQPIENQPFNRIKGHSHAINNTIQLASKVANTDASVLITGESGVGKELFARAIHDASARQKQSFIPVNCGAIPAALFESELFGYEAGAFTGAAKKGKPGKLELADGGTLFLDEVGELPMDMQVKLLRVIQEQEFYRVGGTSLKKINVRFIAATNKDLHTLVKRGEFREDLFYRLNVFSLPVPPLRERKEDLPELMVSFLNEISAKYNKPTPSLPTDVYQQFIEYDWPGNIRQLRNMVERYVVLADMQLNASPFDAFGRSDDEAISTAIRPTIGATSQKNGGFPSQSLKDEKARLEKQQIEQTLHQTYGNKSATARLLGISRATLYQKMKTYNIEWEKH